jgi:hypothetical protein
MAMPLAGLIACCLAVASAAPVAPVDEAAVAVARNYFSLLEQGRYRAALRLRRDDIPPARFARAFQPYRRYHGSLGRPGRIEGAAGSLYLELTVRVSGRLRNGRPFSERGTVTLRRVGDVPGATAAQRRWHIYRTDVSPRF